MQLIRFLRQRGKRLPLRVYLRGLVTWRPLTEPEAGYSVVMGCMRSLWRIATANLRLIDSQRLANLHEVILVFDCLEHEIPEGVRRVVAKLNVPCRIVCYTQRQARRARLIDWGWVYCWLSWAIGVGEAKTRHVLLHDLDALPLHPDLFETLYDNARATRKAFTGVSHYQGGDINRGMELAATYEMVLDATVLRERFRPIELFNRERFVDGRCVDYDTFLEVQSRVGSSAVTPVDESWLVHPSQMICQYVDLKAGRTGFTRGEHNLPILSYYFTLGGDGADMSAAGAGLADPSERAVPLFGQRVEIDGISPKRWAWMEKQIRRVEQRLHVQTRPNVERFLAGIAARAGDARTVGREAGGVDAV